MGQNDTELVTMDPRMNKAHVNLITFVVLKKEAIITGNR